MAVRWRRRGAAIAALASVAILGVFVSGAAGASNASVTLTVWDWGAPPPSLFTTLDAQFMKSHPNIKIRRVHQPFNSYFTLLRSAIAVRKGPDVFQNYGNPTIFAYKQGLKPLTGLIQPATRKNLIGWNWISTGAKASGVPYALPWTGQAKIFYYNKALFAKAGIKAPPLTWDQLLTDCSALTSKGITPIAGGFKDGYYAEWWVDNLAPQYMSDKAAKSYAVNPNWTNPALVQALDDVKQLYDHGCFGSNSESVPLLPDTINNFGAGKAAMFLGLAANAANYSAFAKQTVGPNLGAMLFPLAPGSRWTRNRVEYGIGLAWTISSWSKYPKQAAEYLNFLGSARVEAEVFTAVGAIPNNVKAKPTTTNPVASQILKWMRNKKTVAGPTRFAVASVESVFDRLVPEVVTGAISASDAMRQVEQAQKALPPSK